MSKAFTVSDLITTIAHQLTAAYDEPQLCTQYAWWMLEAITGKKEITLLTAHTITLTEQQQQKVAQWIKEQVQESKPLAYILGTVPFGDLEIKVQPPILIPRPETEEWCLALIEQLKTVQNQTFTILDLCTGTGCIALALAQAFPHATVHGSDIDKRALALAQENARHNHIANVTFLPSDLFQNLPASYDLIVSNPPYIAAPEWKTLDQSVQKWENKDALIAGDDGLTIIKQIIAHAPQHLKTNEEMKQKNIPQLMIEIDRNQAAAITNILENEGYTAITRHKDLEGKDRVISARVR